MLLRNRVAMIPEGAEHLPWVVEVVRDSEPPTIDEFDAHALKHEFAVVTREGHLLAGNRRFPHANGIGCDLKGKAPSVAKLPQGTPHAHGRKGSQGHVRPPRRRAAHGNGYQCQVAEEQGKEEPTNGHSE